MPITLITPNNDGARIKVVGIGGGGGNVINTMVEKGIDGVEFIAINTDSQALNINKADVKIQIGRSLTNGLGAGMRDDIGEKAAEESREEIQRALEGSDMIFITAGMGGGTGTGASPVIAHIAKSLNTLVVAIVTKPFKFEGKPRMELALQGIDKLRKEVDSLIVIPNQKILALINKDTTKKHAFELVDRVLYNATKGISQIVTKTGEINVDFSDVKTIMQDMGEAMIGTGIASGDNRAEKAAQDALLNPILDEIKIKGAKCVLVNIASDGNITMSEIEKINEIIVNEAGEDAKYIMGLVDDDILGDDLMVTLIATGFNGSAVIRKEIPLGDVKQTAINFEKPRTPMITTISGNPEEYDTPAFKRRDIEINNDFSEAKSSQKSASLDDLGLDDFNVDEDYSVKPAFLRRQMD